ncbi:unnamed protein product, partial [Ectocarpus sp. 12 AP-2014]
CTKHNKRVSKRVCSRPFCLLLSCGIVVGGGVSEIISRCRQWLCGRSCRTPSVFVDQTCIHHSSPCSQIQRQAHQRYFASRMNVVIPPLVADVVVAWTTKV